jgi:hypothetical protein
MNWEDGKDSLQKFTDARTMIFIPAPCAPKKAPCPKCGKHGHRKRKVTRKVRTVAFKSIAYLEISCGEYAVRCDCCKTPRKAAKSRRVQPSATRCTASRRSLGFSCREGTITTQALATFAFLKRYRPP